MKIINQTTLTVVGKAEPTTSQDGKNTYYRVACLQNGQATNLSVSEDIYNSIPSGLVEAVFDTSYDDKYNSFRIDALRQILAINGVKPDAKPSGNAPASPAK